MSAQTGQKAVDDVDVEAAWKTLASTPRSQLVDVRTRAEWTYVGIPDLASAQTVLQVCTIVLAGVAAVVPRRKGPLELAALTASLLLAFELSLTHWFYLYLPWVLPFVLLALFLPRESRPDEAIST